MCRHNIIKELKVVALDREFNLSATLPFELVLTVDNRPKDKENSLHGFLIKIYVEFGDFPKVVKSSFSFTTLLI